MNKCRPCVVNDNYRLKLMKGNTGSPIDFLNRSERFYLKIHFFNKPFSRSVNSYSLLTLLLLVLLHSGLFAQKQEYSSKNKSAIKNYEQATRYYDSKNNEAALKELENAISKDEKFVEAYILLANVYVDMDQYDKAIEQYNKALKLAPDFFPNSWYTLAQIELNTGRYADAKNHFNKFLTYTKISETLKKKAIRGLENCDFALIALQHPVNFNPINLGESINTTADEYYPSFTVDGSTLVFTRNEKDPAQRNMPQEDFYISKTVTTGTGKKWTKAVNAGPPLNTLLNEGAPSYSADGRLLFFTACDRDDGMGSCDIYFSRNVNGKWTTPKNLGAPINTGAWETQPSFSSDGKTLYFVRGFHTREGIKQQDIYVTTIAEDGAFKTPEKLNSNINSDDAEESVFIHPDDQTLYFSSRGLPGMGGLDIYMSRRDSNGEWGKAVNLGYPINTYRDENSLLVSPDGSVALFATDRDSGFGGLDLYEFQLNEKLQPQKITFVKCKVTNAITNVALAADYELIDLESGKIIFKGVTDKSNGEFLKALTAGKDYLLNVSAKDYLFYSDHFSCKQAVDYRHPFLLDVKLSPVKAGEKVVLKNIFFATDSFNLQPESFIELDKLVAFLKHNPKIKIQISGHTDNTGDKRKNQVLSENRARSVFDYLVAKNINKSNLVFKGFGDTQPVANNTTEEGRAQNRRTEFLILSID